MVYVGKVDHIIHYSLFLDLSFSLAGRATVKEEGGEEITLELSDFLHFTTGCKTIPPEGFPNKLGIFYDHERPHRKISTSRIPFCFRRVDLH